MVEAKEESAELPKPRFIFPPADVGDVMVEQLEFSLDHGEACTPGCLGCKRLATVRAALLRPFEGRLRK
jgi:hypothetical protein